ncbi:MAG: 4-hydroxythreonine-4-phosphate dehydrogenase PdxA [Bacteroidales bacterium]|nr:4-hydroxythreonine-4-phosphate dehydrogenase PdxA [Bacteroidales bacterium]MDD2322462.1 4-hydroxythreonine-4-phosphate dehydrogenase PdxA [Bacteroidales bacterium]MDD3010589.1 4-hydroxythreonine-4-phosphate dehydrogenase PdxA [Bacteroidales bacterium]MDD3961134.1 4-hydroxythreonine-4-phosphate dehydrogenase PdxA [Bacteroidales bacterium]MDY0286092.1 4-hydroxythreonine-4-phosphate dehydrogenase PdxA [Bacteroidales bacterium]
MESQQPYHRKAEKPVIGITHGNINGTSYELLIKNFTDIRIFDFFTPVVYGSSKVASYHRKVLNREDFSFNLIKRPEYANAQRANIINITENEIRIEMGRLTEEASKNGLLAIDQAISDLLHNYIDAIVMLPVENAMFNMAGSSFSGMDKYLAASFQTEEIMTMMVDEQFKIGFVTGPIPFNQICATLSTELLIQRIGQMKNVLSIDFAIPSPTIAVLGLNPHCEKESLAGAEETEIIVPAIEKCMHNGIQVYGPYSAERFFESGAYKKFDGILALYHDQGILPFRTLSNNDGVLLYTDLPGIVVQPAHDSGLEVAGAGDYNPDASRYALYLAAKIVENRYAYSQDNQDPPVRIFANE